MICQQVYLERTRITLQPTHTLLTPLSSHICFCTRRRLENERFGKGNNFPQLPLLWYLHSVNTDVEHLAELINTLLPKCFSILIVRTSGPYAVKFVADMIATETSFGVNTTLSSGKIVRLWICLCTILRFLSGLSGCSMNCLFKAAQHLIESSGVLGGFLASTGIC